MSSILFKLTRGVPGEAHAGIMRRSATSVGIRSVIVSAVAAGLISGFGGDRVGASMATEADRLAEGGAAREQTAIRVLRFFPDFQPKPAAETVRRRVLVESGVSGILALPALSAFAAVSAAFS